MRSDSRLRSIGHVTAMVFFALAATTGAAAAAEEKLVAPVYPGAARLAATKPLGVDEGVTFFVKDPHEKVQAFYVPKYARLPKEGEGRVRGSAEIPLIAQEVGTVTSIITSMKGDFTWARATEVILEWKPPVMAGSGIAGRFYFELQNQARKHPGHDAELAALKAKYDWLGLAYLHPEKKGEEILKRCSAESSGMDPEVDQTAIANRAAQLAKEGKYDEVAELMKTLEGGDPKAAEKKRRADNFGLWKACIEEAAGYGYLTKVTIDRDPHLWDTKRK
jgi:hypothetical protein